MRNDPTCRWPDIRRIVVVRGGGLGDVLGALPAIDALADAYPDAELTLLTEARHCALFDGRSAVSRALPLPPGAGLLGPKWNPREVDALANGLATIDLGVQIHGGGRHSNRFLNRLGARQTIGTRTDDAPALTRWVPYRHLQNEVTRWLEVAALAGALPVTMEPRLHVTDDDVQRARERLPLDDRPLVVVHPGARDPRRRWPVDGFAAVTRHCLDIGARVALVGAGADDQLLHDIRTRTTSQNVYVIDDADISTLCGLVAGSALVVGNDSGVRHLAQAVGTPTIGMYWIGNLVTAGPLTRAKNRVLVSWTTQCPVCGRDCTSSDIPRCAHDVSFVADVSPQSVIDEVDHLLGSPG